ncbi:MAG: YvcK family protein [Myxococcota bacterium]|jgi:uncharacterized cofD-like protein|nr:YvcK family protein [Myxococcota bacterium]
MSTSPGPGAPRIVCIGGGTGLPVLLRGFHAQLDREHPSPGTPHPELLTGIVAVSDDGGSSGRIIDQYGTLPPGDIRNCVLALADPQVGSVIRRFFDHRFAEGDEELAGHSAGNLLILALSQVNQGDFRKTILDVARIFSIHGQILLPTLQPTLLGARLADGSEVLGESKIPVRRNGAPIERVFLRRRDDPQAPLEAMPEAVEAIRHADAVVLAPGSLYTSLLPNLLVPEIGQAWRETRALRIYVCNLVTEVGETDGYTVEDHVEALWRHLGCWPEVALVNRVPPSDSSLRRYAFDGFRLDWQVAREEIDELLDGLQRGGAFRTPDAGTVERIQARVLFLREKAARLHGQQIAVGRRPDGPALPTRLVEADLAEEVEIQDRGIRKRVLRHSPEAVVTAIGQLLRERTAG